MMTKEPEDRLRRRNHAITMESRERISITGADELLSFHEEEVCVQTAMGVLVIAGETLHIDRLNLDEGQVTVHGYIMGVTYEEPTEGTRGVGVLGRLFGR